MIIVELVLEFEELVWDNLPTNEIPDHVRDDKEYMRQYEAVLVLRPSVTEANRKKLLESVKGWLKGSKVNEKEWGQKPLSYPIKKEVSGYYVSLELEFDVPTVGSSDGVGIPLDFEKKILGLEQVIRHLVVRKK